MNRIDTILEKERTNTDRIFLYLCQDRLMAFGYSAYYAILLLPELEAIQGSDTEGVKYVYTDFPLTTLISLSERLTALIGDEYIEVAVPEEIKSHRDRFGDWMDKIQK